MIIQLDDNVDNIIKKEVVCFHAWCIATFEGGYREKWVRSGPFHLKRKMHAAIYVLFVNYKYTILE